MILVIDVGNTRLKGLGSPAPDYPINKPWFIAMPSRHLDTALFGSGQKPHRVLVSNVAGPAMATTLAR